LAERSQPKISVAIPATITPTIETRFTWKRSLRFAPIFLEADISFGVATRFHFDACFFLKRSNYCGCVFVAEAEVNSRGKILFRNPQPFPRTKLPARGFPVPTSLRNFWPRISCR
jgi:hypothetical protein